MIFLTLEEYKDEKNSQGEYIKEELKLFVSPEVKEEIKICLLDNSKEQFQQKTKYLSQEISDVF